MPTIIRLISVVCLLGGSLLFSNPILSLPPGLSSNDFRVTTFATGLSYPYSMQALPDGSILVGVSTPPASGDYLAATGGLLRLTQLGNTGTAAGPGAMVYSGLPGAVQGVRLLGSNLVAVSEVSNGQSEIAFLRPGVQATDAYTKLGAIQFTSSDPAMQFNITMGTRPTAAAPGSYDLFFSMNGDTDHTAGTGSVTLSGLTAGTLEFNSAASVRVQPTAGAPVVSNFQQIARGLRNTAGIVADPASGNLYLNDNGWDVPGTSTPQSTDELNRLTAAQIGTGVADFGFPNNYIAYRSGQFVGGSGIAPIAAFQPWPDPQTGAESLGPAEMALAPALFPDGLNNGLFLSFYGKWEQAGANNTTGPLVYYDFGTGTYRDVIAPGQNGLGHLASLVSTSDALFVADMNANGTVRHGPVNGVIYEIQAVQSPEPATMIAGPMALLLSVLGLRRRV